MEKQLQDSSGAVNNASGTASTTASVTASTTASGTVSETATAPRMRQERYVQDGVPEMTKLHIETNIFYRYAKTSVACRLANNVGNAREISFNVVLPQSSFISAFHIELNGSIYNAYVKEKEAAKQEYSHAVSRGLTAAKVDLSARDSNRFSVSVNVEANAEVTFNLTYEELLTRRLGTYDHVISIDPGQIVPDLSVHVRIEESNTLTTVKVPKLRVANEVEGESPQNEPLAVIQRPADNIADIKWSPTPDQQRKLRNGGVQGQLRVQYDVERSGNSSQILVSDGYFVHFYAPTDLEPLKKHIVFVLDVSGSMAGIKIVQLKSAMNTVLTDLQEGDYFTIVTFSPNVLVWQPPLTEPIEIDLRQEKELNASFIVAANPENIALAKEYVNNLYANGGTNIHDSLMVGLELINLGRKTLAEVGNVPEPMIVFLTDGQANVGESNNDVIVKAVTQRNKTKTAIFSLAFGFDADKEFLKKLSLKNSAFSRLIYEGSDAALQLEDFYRQVSSPLLSNVTFVYEPQQVDNSSLTNVQFNTLFRGAELVVAGKLESGSAGLSGVLTAKSFTGKSTYGFPVPLIINVPEPVNRTAPGFMEKLWAHLNIQQLLDKQTTEEGDDSPSKARALQLALKYSFVTPLTSLVVVKPNETSRADAEDASVVSADGGKIPLPSYIASSVGHQSQPSPCPPAMSSARFGSAPPQHRRAMPAPRVDSRKHQNIQMRSLCAESASHPYQLLSMAAPSFDCPEDLNRGNVPQCCESVSNDEQHPMSAMSVDSHGGQHGFTMSDTMSAIDPRAGADYRMAGPILVMSTKWHEYKMAALLFLRGLNLTEGFFMGSNVNGAGAFNDVVFMYKLKGEQKFRTCFLQLTHNTAGNQQIGIDALLSLAGNFSLNKFYKSYCEVAEKVEDRDSGKCVLFKVDFNQCDFIIYYNTLRMDYSLIDEKELPKTPSIFATVQQINNPLFFNENTIQKIKKDFITQGDANQVILETDGNGLTDAQQVVVRHPLEEFLRRLQWYTKQASEDQLDALIETEIKKALNTNTADTCAIAKTFVEKMQHWWESGTGDVLTESAQLWQDIIA